MTKFKANFSIQTKLAAEFVELNEIQKAFKYATLIKAGKIKARPIEQLLKEL